MTLQYLLYVSKSTLVPAEADGIVRELVASAEIANKRSFVTGALIFTGRHFAQVLEGERIGLDKLISTIERDPRHRDLKIIERKDIPERRFRGWNLAYSGPSQFVSRHVTQLLGRSNRELERRAGAWVADLMSEFSTST